MSTKNHAGVASQRHYSYRLRQDKHTLDHVPCKPVKPSHYGHISTRGKQRQQLARTLLMYSAVQALLDRRGEG
jgi:hypothetical protein